MSTDRELLELAAKAAGMIILVEGMEWPRENIGWFFNQVGDNPPALYDRAIIHAAWKPLTDDGDALRLAVKLNMRLDILDFSGWSLAANRNTPLEVEWIEEHHSDQGALAATRRAIVRAAAEIGKAMP